MRPMSRGNSVCSCLLGMTLLGNVCVSADEPSRQWHALPVAGGLDELARAAGLESGLPAWRASSGRDAHAVVTAPQFTDATTHDYRLLANGQPALTASSSGGPVGAYLAPGDVIGPRAAPPY